MSFTLDNQWPLAPNQPGAARLPRTADQGTCTYCGATTLTFVTKGKYLAVYACSACGRSIGVPALPAK
jgi:transcription elongation factor Elf1